MKELKVDPKKMVKKKFLCKDGTHNFHTSKIGSFIITQCIQCDYFEVKKGRS